MTETSRRATELATDPTDVQVGARLSVGANTNSPDAALVHAQNPLVRQIAETDPEDLVQVTIDGVQVEVPAGTMIIRAAEMIGKSIPRFCDHPLLDPLGACRQCFVEITDDGRGRPMPKPQTSCTTAVMPGQVIKTQETSEVAAKAQFGINEFLLINHPLDCPICDKGGECPLQNQTMQVGGPDTRFSDVKRTYPKPIPVSSLILLDRDRCVLCARCTRFADQIAGDPLLALSERGVKEQVSVYSESFESYFSGNTIQICPVGALTSTQYRFRARPFDLVSTMSTCEHCSSGCELRVDHRRGEVMRRYAGDDPMVNEEWNCDKGRFGFTYGRGEDRITHPLVRDGEVLRPASWPEAITAAVRGLQGAGRGVGVLPGGRLTWEQSYGWSKFARAVLGTNNIDYRSRPASPEEADFLAAHVAGRTVADSVTYLDVEQASGVLLVDFEPEEESPMVFLRLRKAWRKHHTPIWTVAPRLSSGARKMGARLVGTVPGEEAARLDALQGVELDADSLILVGERAATSPGTLAAAARLAQATGARLAWIPRRAGERAAIEAGALPDLLPGGRWVHEATARVDMQAAWDVDALPTTPGLDAEEMLRAAASGDVQALVVGGVEPADFADPAAVRTALEEVGFLVSVEARHSEVTERADVVFPVGIFEEQSGTFLNWESRERHVEQVITPRTVLDDLRVLAALADGLGRPLGVRDVAGARAEIDQVGRWEGEPPAVAPGESPARAGAAFAEPAQPDHVALATWRTLLDDSRGIDHEADLAATARPAQAYVSYGTAFRYDLHQAPRVRVSAGDRSLVMPLVIEEEMIDGVVWLPTHAPGHRLHELLGVGAGAAVRLDPVMGDPVAEAADETSPTDPSTPSGGVA